MPMVNGQSGVSLASRGAGAFAVWTDYRLAGYGGVYGTRLAADGTVLDPAGILIDEKYGRDPAVVWNGSSYTVIAAEQPAPGMLQRMFMYRLDADGRWLQGRIALGGIDQPRLAADGRDEIAIGGQTLSGSTISFFDRETLGATRAVKSVGAVWTVPVPVADQQDWFGLADDLVCEPKNVNCKVVLDLYAFDDAHEIAKKTTLFDFERDPQTLAAASNDAGRIAMAWTITETVDLVKQQYRRRVFYAVVDRDGRLVAGPTRLERSEIDVGPPVIMWGGVSSDRPNVMWNGDHFVASWKWFDGTGASAIHAIRIDADGNRLEQSPISFGEESTNHIKFDTAPVAVKTDTHLVFGWGAGSTLAEALVLGVTRPVRSFEELTTAQPPALLTSAVSAQSGLDIAANDAGVFAVWVENDAAFGRFLPLAGRTPAPAAISAPGERRAYAPAVAWGGGVFVVVWHEAVYSGFTPVTDRVLMRRYDGAGQPLDPEPAVLAVEGFHGGAYMPQMEIDVGFDGTRFLAVWSGVNDGRVHGVRIPTTGKVLDAVPLALSKAGSVRTGGPNLAWTGNEYVLVFYEDATPSSNGGAPLPILPHLGRMTRVSAEGKVLDTTYPELVRIRGGFDLRRSAFETAWNGRELLVTWAWTQNTFQPYQGCAFAQRFTATGAEIDAEPVPLFCQGMAAGFSKQLNPRPFWDGDRWWLYYSMATPDGGLFAAPLNGAATRLLDRTNAPGAAAAIWTPSGLVFSYLAADDDYGRVYGAFVSRVISPRTRGVRH